MRKKFIKTMATALSMIFCLSVTVTANAASSRTLTQSDTSNDSPWPTQYDGESSRPTTIPALREWTDSSGSFEIGSIPRILIRPKDVSRLKNDAKIFADDLQAVTTSAGCVVVTKEDPGPGDVLLELGLKDDEIGNEGYELTVGSYVDIKAHSSTGVFYGTRTLLQLLKQNSSVPAGVSRDWPRYSERGLMMDIARHYYSYDWLKKRIKDMAYLKLNYLHLHLTDDQGWGVESKQKLQSPQFLTKEQIRSLVALAASYHITVVPEIDMPGHMGWALKSHPEFQLKDKNGVAVYNKLDYSIPAAREFLHSIVKEYLKLFTGEYWHMGADEFLGDNDYQNYPQLEQYAKETCGEFATAKDGLHAFINEINEQVRDNGKILRVWNDSITPETTVAIDKNVVIDWWTDLNTPYPSPTNPKSPQELLLDGYTIQNSSFWPTYDFNDSDHPAPPAVEGMYENWAVQRFHGFAYNDKYGNGALPFSNIDPAEPHNLGSELHYWNDGISSDLNEEQVADSLFPRLRVMAQKTWESAPLVTTYEEFQKIIESVGSAPSKR